MTVTAKDGSYNSSYQTETVGELWSVDLTKNDSNTNLVNLLNSGEYDVSIQAKDVAGNSTEINDTFIIDTSTSIDIVTPLDDKINSNIHVITGRAEELATVTLTIKGLDDSNKEIEYTQQLTVAADADADNSGEWQFNLDPSQLSLSGETIDGNYSYSISSVDIAGNETSTSSQNFVLDTQVIPFTAQLDNDSNSSALDDVITKDDTPTFSGTVEPESTVALTINGKTYTLAASDTSDGTWSITIPDADALPSDNQTHIYTVKATDPLGQWRPRFNGIQSAIQR